MTESNRKIVRMERNLTCFCPFKNIVSFLEADSTLENWRWIQLWREVGLQNKLYHIWNHVDLETLIQTHLRIGNDEIVVLALSELDRKYSKQSLEMSEATFEAIIKYIDIGLFKHLLSGPEPKSFAIQDQKEENNSPPPETTKTESHSSIIDKEPCSDQYKVECCGQANCYHINQWQFPSISSLSIESHGIIFLELCCKFGRHDIAQFLLENKAIEISTSFVDLAFEYDQEEVASLLMQALGIEIEHSGHTELLKPLNKIGNCHCCNAESVDLFENNCGHETCENCSELCGVCQENVCLLTRCMMPLKCFSCGNDFVACLGCVYTKESEFVKCECGKEMAVNDDFDVNYDTIDA